MTKTTKKIKQMGLVLEVNIFVNVYECGSDGFVSVIYQSAQFFFFFCCLPRCMKQEAIFVFFFLLFSLFKC